VIDNQEYIKTFLGRKQAMLVLRAYKRDGTLLPEDICRVYRVRNGRDVQRVLNPLLMEGLIVEEKRPEGAYQKRWRLTEFGRTIGEELDLSCHLD